MLVHTMPRIFPWGWLGVQVFFVLSGFLITGILFDARARPTRFRDFYVRRALRIFPLYYLVLILSAVLSWHSVHPPKLWLWFVYLGNIPWYLRSMHGFSDICFYHHHIFGALGPFWSLSVEEQFYLIWPFVVFAVGSRERLLKLCVVVIATRLVLGVALQMWAPQDFLRAGLLYRMLPTQSDGFLAGAMLALWIRGSSTIRKTHLPRMASFALPAIFCYALLLACLNRYPHLLGPYALAYASPFQGTLGIPLANLASVLLIASALLPGSTVYRFFSLAWLRRLGLISYGFYVLHFYVYVTIRSYIQHWTLHWPLSRYGLWEAAATLLLTYLLAFASFRWIESPFLRLKDRLAPSHRSTPSGHELELVA